MGEGGCVAGEIPTPGTEAWTPGTTSVRLDQGVYDLHDGTVVIAAITSCTNTSNPSVMIGAGLVAKKAVEKGLRTRPWVKTSLAPGSKVVTRYLDRAGLTPYLQALGFHLVGYGCTTCIGNSGPLPEAIAETIRRGNLVAASVLSGNRNFEGRIHPLCRANYLASPMLVVAYALAGDVDFDPYTEPLGNDRNGKPVFLHEIWPSPGRSPGGAIRGRTGDVPQGVRLRVRGGRGVEKTPRPEVRVLHVGTVLTYVKNPPFFENLPAGPEPVAEIAGHVRSRCSATR